MTFNQTIGKYSGVYLLPLCEIYHHLNHPNSNQWPITNYAETGLYHNQIMRNIWYYEYMYDQVKPLTLTQENDQKPHFWLFFCTNYANYA